MPQKKKSVAVQKQYRRPRASGDPECFNWIPNQVGNDNARVSRLVFVLLLLLVFGVFPAPTMAIGTVQNDDGTSFADFNGALRMNAGYAHFKSSSLVDNFVSNTNPKMTTSVIRFISVGAVSERLDFELDVFGVSGSMPVSADGSITNAALTASTYRTRRLTGSHRHRQGSAFSGYGIDRAFVRLNGARANLSFGRMPLNYTLASIFAVNDFFAPFSATSINTVYKPGVDAAKLAIQTGDLSNIELVGVLGNDSGFADKGDPSLQDSALLLYAHTLIGPLDLTAIFGRLAGKWIAGGAVQGNIGSFTLYTEGHVGFLDEDIYRIHPNGFYFNDTPYVQVTGGARWMSGWRNLSITAEYTRFSGGRPFDSTCEFDVYGMPSTPCSLSRDVSALLPSQRYYADEFVYPGKHFSGLSTSVELHPLVYLSSALLMNLTDFSGMGTLSLAASIGDNAEWITGVIFPFGEDTVIKKFDSRDMEVRAWPIESIHVRSEFGDMPITAFTELRYYF